MRRRRRFAMGALRTSAAAGAAAAVGLIVLPAVTQSPGGIAGVTAAGAEPQLVQEGFVFTEGPLGTTDGGLYFSDIRANRIYRPEPNGLTLIRDGRTLIVDDTLGPAVYAYDVQPDGSVKNKRVFAQLRDIPEGKESGADGMALDREDRVYITTVAGVQVFDAAGKYL